LIKAAIDRGLFLWLDGGAKEDFTQALGEVSRQRYF